MPDMGPHAAFIWSSYAIYSAVLGCLIAWLIFDGRKQAAELAKLEARGASRPSAKGQ